MVEILTFFTAVFFPALFDRFIDILYAPLLFPNMFWIIIPLGASVLFMELYFGRYPREELGYHAALENTVFLLFVTVDLVRFLVVEHGGLTVVKILVVITLCVYASLVSVLDFFHRLPRDIAFKISSKSIIGFTAYIGIVIVYSDFLKDLSMLSIIVTILAVIMLFFLFNFIIGFIHFLEPQSHDEVEELLKNVEKELETIAKQSKNNQ